MHQDQRIGLALGVLLIGACAAFFFRNETRQSTPLPKLQHAEDLDLRIAERSTRPYLKGVEAVEATDQKHSAAQSGTESARTNNNSATIRLTRDETMQIVRPRASLLSGEQDVQELAPIAIPIEEFGTLDKAHSDADAADNLESGAVAHSKSVPKSVERTHVVQRGETLSSIASKTLGSAHRFQEIFEANQDQLSNPHELKLGMKLRIPDLEKKPIHESSTRAAETVPQTRQSDARTIEPAVENSESSMILLPPELPESEPTSLPVPTPLAAPATEAEPGKRFVPARRSAPPARHEPQARNDAHRGTQPRRLPQISLESTSSVSTR